MAGHFWRGGPEDARPIMANKPRASPERAHIPRESGSARAVAPSRESLCYTPGMRWDLVITTLFVLDAVAHLVGWL